MGTGRLKFCDFKDLMVSLKFWQSAFKSHTKERTGILKAERLRDALEDVGKLRYKNLFIGKRYTAASHIVISNQTFV